MDSPAQMVGLLVDLDTKEYIEFVYFTELSESLRANWDRQPIRGRSEPQRFYSHTDAHIIPMSFDLAAGVYDGDQYSPELMRADCKLILSWGMPDYNSNLVKPPHRVHLKLGEMFDADGLIQEVTVRYAPPYDTESQLPMIAHVTFTFEVVHDEPKSAFDLTSVLATT